MKLNVFGRDSPDLDIAPCNIIVFLSVQMRAIVTGLFENDVCV
jgi:hypothetical protein